MKGDLSPSGNTRASSDRDAIGIGDQAWRDRQISEPLAIDDHPWASSQWLAMPRCLATVGSENANGSYPWESAEGRADRLACRPCV